jgi:hypothetical protein
MKSYSELGSSHKTVVFFLVNVYVILYFHINLFRSLKMKKLEISFDGRTPYGDDETLSRKVNMEFEIDSEESPERLVVEFNKFLFLLGFGQNVVIEND